MKIRERVSWGWLGRLPRASLAVPLVFIIGVGLAVAKLAYWSLTLLLIAAAIAWFLHKRHPEMDRDITFWAMVFLVIWVAVLGFTWPTGNDNETAGVQTPEPNPPANVPTTESPPTTVSPTTVSPTTVSPTTVSPTTVSPTTVSPTTVPTTPLPPLPPPTCTPAGEVAGGGVRGEMATAWEQARDDDEELRCPSGLAFPVEDSWAQVLNGDEHGPTGVIVDPGHADAFVASANLARLYQAFAVVTQGSSTTIEDAIVNAGITVEPGYFEYPDGGKVYVVEDGALFEGDKAVIVVPPGDRGAAFLFDQVLAEWAQHDGPCGEELGWPDGNQNELDSRPFDHGAIVTLGDRVGLAREVVRGIPPQKHNLADTDWDRVISTITSCATFVAAEPTGGAD